MRRAALILALLPACMGDGNWFIELAPRAGASYVEAPERAIEPGWQKLASEYQVHLTAGTLQTSAIELLPASEAAAAFDPAHPPAGYGPCHNGHCHTPDGRLLSYEEIAAATGGGAASAAVVTLPGTSFDLLAPAVLPLPCQPDCRLGHTPIARARVTLARLHLEGIVRDGPGVTRPLGNLPFAIDLDASTALPTLTAALDLPADNQHPPRAAVTLQIPLGPALFDGVAWPDGVNAAALASVRAALGETQLQTTVQRSAP
jgi:hypothetical protein